MRADADRPQAQVLSPAALRGPVWVVAPHPDDESLGVGRLLAALSDRGTEVWALLVSDGAASHPDSRAWPPERLARERLREWREGLEVLGVPAHRTVALGLPDGALPFPQGAGGEAATGAIRAALARAAPATVLLPWRRDPHPDHRAAHALTAQALAPWPGARRLEYTVWLPERAGPGDLPRPGEAIVWQVGAADAPRKEAAVRCHRSQLGGLIADAPAGFVLAEAMIRRAVDGPELLLEVHDDRP